MPQNYFGSNCVRTYRSMTVINGFLTEPLCALEYSTYIREHKSRRTAPDYPNRTGMVYVPDRSMPRTLSTSKSSICTNYEKICL